MKRSLIILGVNLLFVGILLIHPKSEIFRVWEMSNTEIIYHYSDNISADTGTYVFREKDDIRRTVGYPAILGFFMRLRGFIFYTLFLNCLLGAWIFYVVYQLIGKRAWILAVLGAFTVYVPHLYTDFLFATIFITSIWLLKKKKFWFSLVLIASASLIRPLLAWFFVVIPVVMFFYGYGLKMALLGLPLVFVATCFNPVRNYINHHKWTHSPIIEQHLQSSEYIGGADSKAKYLLYAFKGNCISGHYNYGGMMFNVYKRNNGDREESDVMKVLHWISVLMNLWIWFFFIVRLINKFRGIPKRVNWGDVIILAYCIGPTLFGAAGARLRLPVEWILLA